MWTKSNPFKKFLRERLRLYSHSRFLESTDSRIVTPNDIDPGDLLLETPPCVARMTEETRGEDDNEGLVMMVASTGPRSGPS
ncbi:hypothetical protein BHE74_00003184 [Ensete ventricosum]|nr:hypothetical protein BHE74_00003184 [Ensete ventricosum]RZR76460.1 hypothetical protein BHM03_00001242 [Ensete ventricosum]